MTMFCSMIRRCGRSSCFTMLVDLSNVVCGVFLSHATNVTYDHILFTRGNTRWRRKPVKPTAVDLSRCTRTHLTRTQKPSSFSSISIRPRLSHHHLSSQIEFLHRFSHILQKVGETANLLACLGREELSALPGSVQSNQCPRARDDDSSLPVNVGTPRSLEFAYPDPRSPAPSPPQTQVH